jgi:hypothetical protein
MNNYPVILIDTGIIVAFYDRKDKYHQQVGNFFGVCTGQLVTTVAFKLPRDKSTGISEESINELS